MQIFLRNNFWIIDQILLIEWYSDVSELKEINVSKRLVRGALGQVEEAGKGQNIHSEEKSLKRKNGGSFTGLNKKPFKYPIKTD